MNPRGYEFTWSDDRNWQKNLAEIDGSFCKGVFLERNYDFELGAYIFA